MTADRGNGMCGDAVTGIPTGDGPPDVYHCDLTAGHDGWHQVTQHPLREPMRWTHTGRGNGTPGTAGEATEATQADIQAARKLAHPLKMGLAYEPIVQAIAAALAAEREKARAPFLEMAERLERQASGWRAIASRNAWPGAMVSIIRRAAQDGQQPAVAAQDGLDPAEAYPCTPETVERG